MMTQSFKMSFSSLSTLSITMALIFGLLGLVIESRELSVDDRQNVNSTWRVLPPSQINPNIRRPRLSSFSQNGASNAATASPTTISSSYRQTNNPVTSASAPSSSSSGHHHYNPNNHLSHHAGLHSYGHSGGSNHQPNTHHKLSVSHSMGMSASVARPTTHNRPTMTRVAGCDVPITNPFVPAGCLNRDEEQNKRTAIAEFQRLLRETSQEVHQLVRSYLVEFRGLSLDLVHVAGNNTLMKLRESTLVQYYEPTKRLFDSIHSHLDRFEMASSLIHPSLHSLDLSGPAHHTPMLRPDQGTSAADINQVINGYFRQLYLIQLKSLLDRMNHNVDLECLAANLQSQQSVESILAELVPKGKKQSHDLALDQMRLTQSIMQSLEFARTLLSSLTVANEMFHNLTHNAAGWMPHQTCHNALVRMTVCPECQPLDRSRLNGSPIPPPCENFCLNVVQGCMNDIYEINTPWAKHVDALSSFTTNMLQINNIENVMSTLEEKLHAFIMKLDQTYNSNLATGEQRFYDSGTLKLVRLCPAASGPGRSQNGAQSARGWSPGSNRRLQALVLPPTQQSSTGPRQPAGQHYASSGSLLVRPRQQLAGQPAAYSLFNRLYAFVHRLEGTRDFFARWPGRVCRRLRHTGANNNHALQEPRNSSSPNGPNANCWNGFDFNGYSKALVPLGQPLTQQHPELPMNPTGVNQHILTIFHKLRDTAGQLSRKSTRSPAHLSFYHSVSFLNPVEPLSPMGLVRQQPLQANGRSIEPKSAASPLQTNNQQQQVQSAAIEQLMSKVSHAAAAAHVDPEEEEADMLELSASQVNAAVTTSSSDPNFDETTEQSGAQGGTELDDEDGLAPHCSDELCSDLFNDTTGEAIEQPNQLPDNSLSTGETPETVDLSATGANRRQPGRVAPIPIQTTDPDQPDDANDINARPEQLPQSGAASTSQTAGWSSILCCALTLFLCQHLIMPTIRQ